MFFNNVQYGQSKFCSTYILGACVFLWTRSLWDEDEGNGDLETETQPPVPVD